MPRRIAAAAAILCLLALALACGKKGDPRPKSDVVSSLAAPHPAAEKRA